MAKLEFYRKFSRVMLVWWWLCWLSLSGLTLVSTSDLLLQQYSHKCAAHPKLCRIIDFPTTLLHNLSYDNLVHVLEGGHFQREYHRPLLQEVDFYFLLVNLTLPSQHSLQALSPYYDELDRFILNYPWWVVKIYPLPPATLSTSKLLLQRLPRVAEESSRQYAATSLLSPTECLQRPVFLKSTSSSWGIDIISSYPNFFHSYAEYIHLLYLTVTNDVHDDVGFVEKDQCFQLKNKHLCTFLPSTNCTVLCNNNKNNKMEDCFQEGFYAAGNRSYSHENNEPDRTKYFLKYFTSISNFTATPKAVLHIEDIEHIDAQHVSRLQEEDDFSNPSRLHAHYWLFNVAYKANYHLGMRVQHMLHEFYHNPHNVSNVLPSSQPHEKTPRVADSIFAMGDHCVAVHIRKGDRHIPGVNMVEWCANHTKINEAGEKEPLAGKRPDGEEVDYGFWADMGCDFPYPYGTISLQAVVNASMVLYQDAMEQQRIEAKNTSLQTKKTLMNILIATDEHHSMKKELAIFATHGYGRDLVRVVVIPTKIKNIHAGRSRATWQATTEWWGTVDLLRQCDIGFVAHPGSAASLALYMALCYQHGNTYFHCPPFLQFHK